MATIDRSKFKPSSVTKMKEADSQLNSTMGRSGGGGGRAGMLDIVDGKNIFRIYPAHPEPGLNEDEQPGFSQPSVKTFLPMMVAERDAAGKETGETKEGYKPVFNSRVHGDTPKDLVEEYIKLARAVAEAEFDSTEKGKVEKQKFLDKIYGKYSKIATERLMGINYKTNHVMYVDKIEGTTRTFGRLEVKDSVKTRMNQIAAVESEDEPMGVDPYTHLDDGRAIVINYNSKATKPADYYITNLDSDIDKVTKMAKFYPIDDDLLEEFMKQPTLMSMYVKVFKRKDFELQLEGLEFFDNKNKMGLCEREEWQNIVEEISGYYSADDDTAQEEQAKEEPETVVENDGDEFTTMTRNQLKIYIAQNSLGIVAKPTLTDDNLRDSIREAIATLGEEELLIVEEKAKPVATTTKPTGRLSGLRKVNS